tara:strand:+ start:5555 stop:5839 length:285 start_codon:yes stop_codon:yes gene_type:complete
MAITKQTITASIDTVKAGDHYCINVREVIQIIEDNEIISEKNFRYVLTPDADVSEISDPVVKAQFNAVMTDEIKANYQTFLASQEPVVTEESSE